MTTISGFGTTYNSSQIIGSVGSVIVRKGFTTQITDILPDSSDMIAAEFGTSPINHTGQHFSVSITNASTSDVPIIQQMGLGQTLKPASSFNSNEDVILNGQTNTYYFIITSVDTMDVYLTSSATGPSKYGITLDNAKVLVGDSDNRAQQVTISGEGTFSNAGVFSLGPQIASSTEFTDTTNATTSGTGGIFTLGGLGVAQDIFSDGKITAGSATGFSTGGTQLVNGSLSGLNLPVSDTDATSKLYVDNLVEGLSWKKFVRVVGVAQIPLTGLPTIDSVPTTPLDRVLLTGQSIGSQNGVWVVQGSGVPFERPDDFSTGSSAASSSMFVSEGTVYKDGAWVCTGDKGSSVVDANSLSFVQFSSGALGVVDINSQPGPNVTFAVGTGGSNFSITASANIITYDLPDAGPSSRGVISTGSQVLEGIKTFNDNVVVKSNLQLDSTAVGDIQLSAPTTAVTSYNLVFPDAQATASGQVLENDGSGNLSFTTPFVGSISFWYGYGPLSSFAVTASPTTVEIEQQVQENQSYASSSGVLTVPSLGCYKVSYTAQFTTLNQSGGQRSSYSVQLFTNRNSAGSLLEPGTKVSCYMREQNDTGVQPSCTKTVVLSLLAFDTVDMRVSKSGTTVGEVIADECSLTIERIK
jgi:hypothetical protein